MSLEPLCVQCPGERKQPSKAYWRERIPWICRHSDQYTDAEIISAFWDFTAGEVDVKKRAFEARDSFTEDTISAARQAGMRLLHSLKDADAYGFSVDAHFIPLEFLEYLLDDANPQTA